MSKKIRIILIIILILAVVAGGLYFSFFRNKPQSGQDLSGSADQSGEVRDLNVPWEIVFLPDGQMLVSEREGYVKLIGKQQKTFNIESARSAGEGGLLGMVLHPNYPENHWIYFYSMTQGGGELLNRVIRYTFDGVNLFPDGVILDNLPAASNHNGGRLAFGPDGFLYVATGDATTPGLAQDVSSLAGKILRITDEGGIPPGNPFGNAVWAFGLRNPQGMAWDDKGRLWATDHGRSGALSGLDELNLIEEGKNYGWPEIQGTEERQGMQKPILQSGDDTWAPAGAAHLGGSVFFSGLRGEALYEAKITENKVELKTHLKNQFGRIRAVVAGLDGFLYISTSNRDGRGTPKEGDDKIIKIDPKKL